MPRYIDAEKITFRLPVYTAEDGEVLIPLLALRQCINQIPTADVRENIQAEWVKDNGYYKCSNCKAQAPNYGTYVAAKFCYICGAKIKCK